MRGGRLVVVLVCVAGFLGVCKPMADAVDPAPPAQAASTASQGPGTQRAEIQTDSPFGVSVAYDGDFLDYTDFDGSVLHRVDPLTQARQEVAIVGADGINALSYDSLHRVFWGMGSDGSTIYMIPKPAPADAAVTAMPTMNVAPILTTHGFCDSDVGCQPLVDGLGYDGTTNTLWFTPDGSGRIYNFDVNLDTSQIVDVTDANGFLNGWFDINDPGPSPGGTGSEPDNMAPQCNVDFSSGVAAGAGFLYLTNGDCVSTDPTAARAWYFRYAKTLFDPPDKPCLDPALGPIEPGKDPFTARECPGDKIDFFPYNAERAEDLECDDRTFNVNVMWIRDAVDGFLRAYELPVGTCIFGGGVAVSPTVGRFTGGGYLASPPPSTILKVHTSFVLQCDTSLKPNHLQITWSSGSHFRLETATLIKCDTTSTVAGSTTSPTQNRNTGMGTGRLNGNPHACATWTFTDNGEPGSKDLGHVEVYANDTCTGTPVVIGDGPLVGGNYQAHG